MLKKYIILFSTISLISFFGCDSKTENVEPGLNEKYKFILSEYENVLRKNIIIPDTLSILFENCGKRLRYN